MVIYVILRVVFSCALQQNGLVYRYQALPSGSTVAF